MSARVSDEADAAERERDEATRPSVYKTVHVLFGPGVRVEWRSPGSFTVTPEDRRPEVEAALAQPIEEFYSVPLRDESGEVIGMGCYATRMLRPGTLRHARRAVEQLQDKVPISR